MVAFARPAAGRLSILAALMLAACAAGGPLATPPGAPPVAVEQTLRAADGSRIAATEWEPDGPVAAVILALHGFGDHGQSTFAAAARSWAERGILTVAIDQRGFGHNASRGRWPGEDALVADAVTVSRQLRARFPCKPLTVVGHSMGGGVVLAAAARGLAGEGIVLAAPAIWGGEQMNPLHRLVAWTAAAVAPDKRYGGGIVKIQATDNIDALRQMQADPLYLRRPSSRELMGLVRVTDAAAAAAGRVRMPALLLLGEKDQIVPNGRVREVFEELDGPKEIIAYEQGWHLLFRDLQAANVWRDVADWALARPAPACVEGQPVGAAIPVRAPAEPRLPRRRT